jgi:hypothetical protein
MKWVIIAVLVSIIFVLVYSRIRPYLLLIRKLTQSLNASVDVGVSTASQQKTPSRNKLVRCERCGTWVPAARALRLNAGLATFCSAECMAQTGKERKIAG